MQTQTLGLVLMSIAITQYGVVPLIADLSATHARNPRWSPHARFHVVTQVLTSASIAAVAMFLLWSPSIERAMGVCLAAALSLCVLGAFFVSTALRSLYGGTLSDAAEEGGISKAGEVDLNALNFGSALLMLAVGRLLLL
jgi:hypothetical protein